MTRRSAAVALLSAAVLLGTGCGEKCKNETPAVFQAPTCGTLQAGAEISVHVNVCPACDNVATCAVLADELASTGIIQLEPQAEVCEDSCPSINPGSCPFRPLTCRFTAPVSSNANGYTIYLIDPASPDGFRPIPFDVGTTGGTTCDI
jgi:Fe-S-cluster containining protein